MKCKFCQAELDENTRICPACGKYNPEDISTDETPETDPAAAAPEETPAQEAPSEVPAPENDVPEDAAAPVPGMSAGKLTLLIGLGIAVIALIIALIVAGVHSAKDPAELPATAPTASTVSGETTDAGTPPSVPDLNVTEGTIPADGSPENVTCKGTYTVDDDVLLAQRDTVIATAGDKELTVELLQMYYWMGVYDFMENYGTYLPYFGLNPNLPLDTQSCNMMQDTLGTITWQQYFLQSAISTWHRYQAMASEADKAGIPLNAEFQAYLDGLADSLQASAVEYGYESAEQMIQADVGAVGAVETYKTFRLLAYKGFQYFDQEYDKLTPTDADIEAYFTEHAADFEKEEISKESGKLVDVRHILIAPQGGTKDESGKTTYSDAEWAAAEQKAQTILDQWLAGEHTEDSFGKLAEENTEDPGSKATGGLYTSVGKGQMVPEFDAWCFDEARKSGDYGIVKTQFGYHIMYYVGSEDVWYTAARTRLLEELSDKLVTDTTAKYELNVDYSKIVLSTVAQKSAS